MKFLVLIVVLFAALTMGASKKNAKVEELLQTTADAVVANNLVDARRAAVSGLRQIRRVGRKLRMKRRKCGSVSCVRKINRRLRNLRKQRRSFRRLEKCAARFPKRDARRESCARKVVRRQDAAVTVEKVDKVVRKVGKAQTVKKVVKTAIKSVEENEYVQETGEAAIISFRTRLSLLKKRRKDCKKLDKERDRKNCVKQVKKERRLVRREAKLLARIEKCVQLYPDNKGRRKRCTKNSKKRLLRLLKKMTEKKPCARSDYRCRERRAKRGAKETVKKVVKKVTKKEKKEKKVKKGKKVSKKAGKTVKAVRKAVKAAEKAPVMAGVEGEKAIAALRERVKKFKARRKACDKKKGEARKTCKEAIKKELKKNKKERHLVRKLEKCARKFRNNDDRRTNCVARVVRVLMQMVDPIPEKAAPANLRRLEKEEDDFRSDLVKQLRRLNNQKRSCETEKCKRRVKRGIRRVRRQIRKLDEHFTPRRTCLMQRRKVRNNEFRTRATEHMTLYELHTEASNCETLRCVRTFAKSQRQLEKSIRAARSKRKAAWNKLRCPLIDAVKPKTTTEKIITYSTDAPKKRDGKNRERARLHLKLNKLYRRLDNCDDSECKFEVRSKIDKVKGELKMMSRRRRKRLARARRRHLRRAILHKKLHQLYLQAADCPSRRCRKDTRRELRKYKKALKKINRSFLGTKRVGRRVNRYVRALRNELRECGMSKKTKACRDEVFARFRRQTEKRDRAVLHHLRRLALEKVEKDIQKCTKKPSAKRKKCVKKVQKWESKRLAELQIRLIELERRRAIRMCDSTSNTGVCAKAVSKEFKADKKRAKKEAKKVAAKDVQRVLKSVAPKLAKRSTMSAAASLSVSMMIVIVATLSAVLLF